MHTVFSAVSRTLSTVHVNFAAHQISLLLLQLMAQACSPPDSICPVKECLCRALWQTREQRQASAGWRLTLAVGLGSSLSHMP